MRYRCHKWNVRVTEEYSKKIPGGIQSEKKTRVALYKWDQAVTSGCLWFDKFLLRLECQQVDSVKPQRVGVDSIFQQKKENRKTEIMKA